MVRRGTSADLLALGLLLHAGLLDRGAAELREEIHDTDRLAGLRLRGQEGVVVQEPAGRRRLRIRPFPGRCQVEHGHDGARRVAAKSPQRASAVRKRKPVSRN